MSYMLLILETGEERRSRPLEQGKLAMERMVRFRDDLMARGLCKGAESLLSDAKGVRIQSRGGKRTVSDGPFAEAKEMVGGIFLLTCETKEQALAIAHECPATEWATVEVRELGPCFAG